MVSIVVTESELGHSLISEARFQKQHLLNVCPKSGMRAASLANGTGKVRFLFVPLQSCQCLSDFFLWLDWFGADHCSKEGMRIVFSSILTPFHLHITSTFVCIVIICLKGS